MALTKFNFYLGLIFIVGIMSALILNFGDDLLTNPNANLDEDSISYIGNYSTAYNSQHMNDYEDHDTLDDSEYSYFLSDNTSGDSSVVDSLGVTAFFKDQTAPILNPIKRILNIPRFFMLTLGLPETAIKPILNTLGVVLGISLIVIFMKLINGGNTQ